MAYKKLEVVRTHRQRPPRQQRLDGWRAVDAAPVQDGWHRQVATKLNLRTVRLGERQRGASEGPDRRLRCAWAKGDGARLGRQHASLPSPGRRDWKERGRNARRGEPGH